MQSLAKFVVPVSVVEADTPIDEARAILAAAPAAWGAVAMRDGGAIGLASRAAIDAAGNSAKPLHTLTGEPAIVGDISTSPRDAAAQIASRSDRSGDVMIVCSDEAPVGVCTLSALIEGLRDSSEPRLERLQAELLAPLSTLLTITELLQRQPLLPEIAVQVDAIQDIGLGMRRALQSAEDITLAAQGALEFRAAPLQLRGLLDEVQAGWEPRCRRSGVRLLISYDGDPELRAMADSVRLRQIFDCLIDTALFYNPAGALEVSMKTTAREGRVCIEGRVRDSTAGLSPERLVQLFEMGEISHGPAWLNLAAARRLLAAMNGGLRGESNPGAGVTAIFELACEPVSNTCGEDRPAAMPTAAAHILIVDDNATNRMVAEALVEMFDCTSECAVDGVEAVEIASTGRFDLILMDIKMPRMDGVEACRTIRGLSGPAATIPIVALTANADPEDVRAYMAAGMCGVVEKPIKPEQLMQAIDVALQSQADPARSAAA